MKNRKLLTFRDTWNKFKTGVAISPYSIYEVGLANQVNLAQLFTNTTFSGLSQYTYPQILQRYPYFEEKNNQWVQVKHMSELVESLWATYSESFCAFVDYDNDATTSEVEALEVDRVKKFYSVLFSVLDDTWDKYDMMLSMYEANKSKLLDAVKTITEGESSRTVEGENEGSRSATSSGTTSNSSTTTFNTSDVDSGSEAHTGTDTHATTYDTSVDESGTDKKTGTDTHTTTHNTSEAVTINDDTSGSDETEVAYASQVANTRANDITVNSNNKVKDTPQTSIDPSSDAYNSQVGNTNTVTDEDSTSTDVRSGKDTTTVTYGKEIDRTESRTHTGTDTLEDSYNSTDTIRKTTDKTGTESLLDTFNDTITKGNTHTKTGTEAVAGSGTTSGTDSETTSGSNSSSENGESSTTVSDDRDTLMARIDEIDNKYKMLVHNWAKEFKSLFWEVVEYEE